MPDPPLKKREALIHQRFLNALLGKDRDGQRVEVPDFGTKAFHDRVDAGAHPLDLVLETLDSPRWRLARQVIDEAERADVEFLYETLTAHPKDWLTLYFHAPKNFPDDENGTERLALLNRMEKRTGQALTPDASRFLPHKAPTKLAQTGPLTWEAKRATDIHQHFLFAL